MFASDPPSTNPFNAFGPFQDGVSGDALAGAYDQLAQAVWMQGSDFVHLVQMIKLTKDYPRNVSGLVDTLNQLDDAQRKAIQAAYKNLA